MRGRDRCWAHREWREDAYEPDGSEFVAGIDGKDRALFARRVRDALDRLERTTAGGRERESLAEEIEALRLVLARLLAEEDDPARLAASIPRIVDAVVRAVRMERMLSGTMAEGLTEAVTQLLAELGLDEAR